MAGALAELAAELRSNVEEATGADAAVKDKAVSSLPAVVATTPPRFDISTQKQEMLAYLEEMGYAVVAGVADAAAIERGKSLMWDFLEELPGSKLRRNDIETWDDKTWWPDPSTGIIGGFGFGQSAFMWEMRLLPKVKETFSTIWGTSDLVVSFDGGNAFRPWQVNRSWLTRGGWYHVDQNAWYKDSRGKCCVQGLVTLHDASEETGGLVVLPRSHKLHEELCTRCRFAKSWGDFVPLPAGDDSLAVGGQLIMAQAGDLILWDSRTIHCNTPSLKACSEGENVPGEGGEELPGAAASPDGQSQPELLRQVAYVCMTPAAWASQEVLRRRQEAYVQNTSTSHWPHKFVSGGSAPPDTPPNDPTCISAEQRLLIGYDREATEQPNPVSRFVQWLFRRSP
eukprot:TRINITY_DN10313_c0_g1_i1.p1 TRINITY_DN10313_c0_g1~~TRINITY_DN10313_c0_g1_i1.p1  ORF type:complete len:397 (-),score=69.87 TRINITY_DN10313_c0_g1_i1:322-1512(-)